MKTNTNSSEFRQISNDSIDASLADSGSMEYSDSLTSSRDTFLIVYTCIIVFGTLFFIARSFSFFALCLRVSINLHDMIFRGVSRAKMVFFNNNPSGRILNRFSDDINNVDALLPNTMADVLDVSKINTKSFMRLRFSKFVNSISFSLTVFLTICGNYNDNSHR